MLERMSPEQFDKWMAAYNLDPWGNEEFNAAREAAILHNGFLNLIAAATLSKTDESLFRSEDDFMPGAKERKPKERRLTDQEAEALDRARYGRK